MSSMSYAMFRNCLSDLKDCATALADYSRNPERDEPLSSEEWAAVQQFPRLLRSIIGSIEEIKAEGDQPEQTAPSPRKSGFAGVPGAPMRPTPGQLKRQ